MHLSEVGIECTIIPSTYLLFYIILSPTRRGGSCVRMWVSTCVPGLITSHRHHSPWIALPEGETAFGWGVKFEGVVFLHCICKWIGTYNPQSPYSSFLIPFKSRTLNGLLLVLYIALCSFIKSFLFNRNTKVIRYCCLMFTSSRYVLWEYFKVCSTFALCLWESNLRITSVAF